MKKLLMGSVAILIFAIAISLIQISCSKITASPTSPTAQINKIVYAQYLASGAITGFYTANYDGTGQTKVNVTLPAGYTISNQHQPSLSPDGAKLFFVAIATGTTYVRSIFSCDINGSNLVRIVDCPTAPEIQLGGAY